MKLLKLNDNYEQSLENKMSGPISFLGQYTKENIVCFLILRDFTPFRRRCPATNRINKELGRIHNSISSVRVGRGCNAV